MLLPGHDVPLGRYTTVRRLLPQRQRRMVGAWCFVDHFGPDDVAERPGMEVPPHPHTGLQTVTWLLDGEILHRDSLGNVQPIRPGQLNLMTAGHGIAHSEGSPGRHPPRRCTACSSGWRCRTRRAPGPPTSSTTPTCRAGATASCDVTLLVGEFAGERSPAVVHTPLLGAQVELRGAGADHAAAAARLRVRRCWPCPARPRSTGCRLDPGALLYLGTGRRELAVRARRAGRLLLLGGEPFEEPLVMWWNFVGRSHEEVAAARDGLDGRAAFRGRRRRSRRRRCPRPRCRPPASRPATAAAGCTADGQGRRGRARRG